MRAPDPETSAYLFPWHRGRSGRRGERCPCGGWAFTPPRPPGRCGTSSGVRHQRRPAHQHLADPRCRGREPACRQSSCSPDLRVWSPAPSPWQRANTSRWRRNPSCSSASSRSRLASWSVTPKPRPESWLPSTAFAALPPLMRHRIAEAIMKDPVVALEVHAREELGLRPGKTGNPVAGGRIVLCDVLDRRRDPTSSRGSSSAEPTPRCSRSCWVRSRCWRLAGPSRSSPAARGCVRRSASWRSPQSPPGSPLGLGTWSATSSTSERADPFLSHHTGRIGRRG